MCLTYFRLAVADLLHVRLRDREILMLALKAGPSAVICRLADASSLFTVVQDAVGLYMLPETQFRFRYKLCRLAASRRRAGEWHTGPDPPFVLLPHSIFGIIRAALLQDANCSLDINATTQTTAGGAGPVRQSCKESFHGTVSAASTVFVQCVESISRLYDVTGVDAAEGGRVSTQ
jgi:hypothetical protein